MLTLEGNTQYTLTLNQNKKEDGTLEIYLSFVPQNKPEVSVITENNANQLQSLVNTTPQTPLISQTPTPEENRVAINNLTNPVNVVTQPVTFTNPMISNTQPWQPQPGAFATQQTKILEPNPTPNPQQPIMYPQQQQLNQIPTTFTQTVVEPTQQYPQQFPQQQVQQNTQPWQQPIVDTNPVTQTQSQVTETEEKEKPKRQKKKEVSQQPIVDTEDMVIFNYKVVRNPDGTVTYTNQLTGNITLLQYPKNNNFITVEVYEDGYNKYAGVLQKYNAQPNQQRGCYSICVTDEIFVTEIMSQLGN